MDADSTDGPRVTRARTRRMSTLDTDHCVTPQDRVASPRLTRRTRLNSSTLDVRTPTRSTRLSVARGETPDPVTPTLSLSAAKRATTTRAGRTPANAVRKQLTLPEETEPTEIKLPKDDSMWSPGRNVGAAACSLSPTEERRVTRSMSNTPPVGTVRSPHITPPTDGSSVKRTVATRLLNITPPVAGGLINTMSPVSRRMINTTPPPKKVDIQNSPKANDKQTKDIETATEIVDAPIEEQQKLQSDEAETGESNVMDNAIEDDVQPSLQSDIINEESVESVIATKVSPRKSKLMDNPMEDDVQQASQSVEIATRVSPRNSKLMDKPTEDDVQQTLQSDKVTDESIAESKSIEDDVHQSLQSDMTATGESMNKSKLMDKSIQDDVQQKSPKVNVIVEDMNKSPKAELNKSIAKDQESFVMQTDEIVDEAEAVQATDDATDKLHASDGDIFADAPLVSDDVGANVTVPSDIFSANLTPKPKTRVVEEKQSEPSKIVVFNGNERDTEVIKPKYPKTPARIFESELDYKQTKSKKDTPLKPIILRGRNSSTPLAKPEASLSPSSKPPAQIDVVKPFSALDDKAADNKVQITKEKLSLRLDSDDEGEEELVDQVDEDTEEEEEKSERSECDFFDTEAEVIENYKSGDSMDSSTRQEMEDNEISHRGESVGSQDTSDDEPSDESGDEKMSFIVSDDSVDNDDGDDSNIESLCFSSASEEELALDSKKPKKRQRIIVHDSSEDETQQDNKLEKSIIKDTSKVKEEEAAQLPIKTAKQVMETKLNSSKIDLGDSDEAMEIEEVPSSSDESAAQEEKIISISASVVLDSEDDNELDGEDEDLVIQCNSPSDDDDSNEKLAHSNEKLTINDDKPTSTSKDEQPSPNPIALESVASVASESSAFHGKQKREDEEALLAELSSGDLSHLKQMFNPLQKSRRQTLYVQDTQKEPMPKLKRRSIQLDKDVKPSQSFIETLALEKRRQSKRKRLSKSFSGTADGLDTSVAEEVQSKKAKKTGDADKTKLVDGLDTSAAEEVQSKKAMKTGEADKTELVDGLDTSVAEEVQSKNAKKTGEADKTKLVEDVMVEQASASPTLPVQPKEEPAAEAKSRSFYLKYCENILEVANEAKRQQKKDHVQRMLETTSKKVRPATVSASVAVPSTAKAESVLPVKIKKDVKRLQATKHAVKHAMQLLVPEKPQTLARKLSPQPEVVAKTVKAKKQPLKKINKKKSTQQVSPVKSSDEENHATKRIKTTAGYVVETNDEDSERTMKIETVHTRSGIMKVEPCTPTHKYFKEMPSTPKASSGFTEVPATPKTSKKKPVRNPATESALRFKQGIFGRNYK